jgi:predicted Fe-S protein YdhL (DUF1289 family)
MISPCIKICDLDPNKKFCIGCFRTIEEISMWSSFSNEQQIMIVKNLEERKNDYLGN